MRTKKMLRGFLFNLYLKITLTKGIEQRNS